MPFSFNSIPLEFFLYFELLASYLFVEKSFFITDVLISMSLDRSLFFNLFLAIVSLAEVYILMSLASALVSLGRSLSFNLSSEIFLSINFSILYNDKVAGTRCSFFPKKAIGKLPVVYLYRLFPRDN